MEYEFGETGEVDETKFQIQTRVHHTSVGFKNENFEKFDFCTHTRSSNV